MILIAILLPAIAFLMIGRPFAAIIALLLMITGVGWIVASIWAAVAVADRRGARRHGELMKRMDRGDRGRR